MVNHAGDNRENNNCDGFEQKRQGCETYAANHKFRAFQRLLPLKSFYAAHSIASKSFGRNVRPREVSEALSRLLLILPFVPRACAHLNNRLTVGAKTGHHGAVHERSWQISASRRGRAVGLDPRRLLGLEGLFKRPDTAELIRPTPRGRGSCKIMAILRIRAAVGVTAIPLPAVNPQAPRIRNFGETAPYAGFE